MARKKVELAVEGFVVGALLTVLSLILTYAYEFVSTGGVVWFPSHFTPMILVTFASGALFHILFEYYGLNAWYVSQYEPYFD